MDFGSLSVSVRWWPVAGSMIDAGDDDANFSSQNAFRNAVLDSDRR
jgi:hypothetical protein